MILFKIYSPWLTSKGLKEGKPIDRFYILTDWIKYPPEVFLKTMIFIKDKLVIFDPAHSLFFDITKPKLCRDKLIYIQKKCLNITDTSVYVNHPKAFWKENKLSGAELNAGSKALPQVCRANLILRENKDLDRTILEHSKQQLSPERYMFNLVEDEIKNSEGVYCSYSKIEDFQKMGETENQNDAITKTIKKLPKKRFKTRDLILKVLLKMNRTGKNGQKNLIF